MNDETQWGSYTPPPPPERPRSGWKRKIRNLVAIPLTILVAAIILIGIGASLAGNGHKTAKATPAASPATASSPDPSLECLAEGGTWDGTTCDTATPTPSPSGPDQLSVGDQEGVADSYTNATEGTVTVTSVRVLTYPVQAYGSRPANGYYLVVHVTATADPGYTDGFDISEADFYALHAGSHYDNGNGNSYDALTDSQNAQDLGFTTLGASQSTDGWLSFDVPSRHGYIVYSPNSDGQPLAEWKF